MVWIDKKPFNVETIEKEGDRLREILSKNRDKELKEKNHYRDFGIVDEEDHELDNADERCLKETNAFERSKK